MTSGRRPPVWTLAIREQLGATAAEWLPQLFPHARLSPDHKTLRCADLSGRPPRNEGSCVIHLRGPRAGWGYDHATGESAGPIDLIHHSTGLTPPALFEEAARQARLDAPMHSKALSWIATSTSKTTSPITRTSRTHPALR